MLPTWMFIKDNLDTIYTYAFNSNETQMHNKKHTINLFLKIQPKSV